MALTASLIGSSNTTVYTSSATAPVLGNAITCIILCNTSGSAVSVSVYAVPNNAGAVGTASATNLIISSLSIPPGETVSLDQEKLVLSNNDTIVAIAGTAAAVSMVISYLAV
jgi:hypothetical protein